MNKFLLAVKDVYEWIQKDWASNHLRFCVEVVAWLIGLSCSLLMALTVPTPPLKLIYPMWIVSCGLFAWTAWTRRSFGMMSNYTLLMCIDAVATVRLFWV